MTVTNAGSSLDEPYKLNEIEHLPIGGMKEVSKQTYLQYLMEVLVKTEFPSELALFLLQLLPNQNYKVCKTILNFQLSMSLKSR